MATRETSGFNPSVRRSPAASSSPARDLLLAMLMPVVDALGYDLEDISVTAAGRRSVVRVIVDSDTGIDLDAVADVARAVSEALDSSPDAAVSGPYVLEVSSPGVDRPLTAERHWRRAVGRLVNTSVDGVALRARISSVTTDTVTFETGIEATGAGLGGPKVTAQLSQLAPGRIEVEFSRPGQSPDWDNEDVAALESEPGHESDDGEAAAGQLRVEAEEVSDVGAGRVPAQEGMSHGQR